MMPNTDGTMKTGQLVNIFLEGCHMESSQGQQTILQGTSSCKLTIMTMKDLKSCYATKKLIPVDLEDFDMVTAETVQKKAMTLNKTLSTYKREHGHLW